MWWKVGDRWLPTIQSKERVQWDLSSKLVVPMMEINNGNLEAPFGTILIFYDPVASDRIDQVPKVTLSR